MNSKNMNMSAVHGMITTFLRICERFKPDYVAVSFDRKEPVFRKTLYSEYKANRPPMPEDLIHAMTILHDFFERIGVKLYSTAGFEADDVLCTIACTMQYENEVTLITGDKDYNQLVNDRIRLYEPYKEQFVTIEDVYNRYGVYPAQFIDYLALVGDSSDNIPGAKGIGPKKAQALLQQFESLEGIYTNIDSIPSASDKAKLLEAREMAFLSQKLAAMVKDVPLNDVDLDSMRFNQDHYYQALPLLKEYELKQIIKKLGMEKRVQETIEFSETEEKREEITTVDVDSIEFTEVLVDTEEIFASMLRKMESHTIVAIDTETSELDPMKADLVGISLCVEKGTAYYIPVGHKMSTNLPLDDVIKRIKRAVSKATLLAHNLKYDYLLFKRQGWTIQQPVFDTMIAAYLLNPGANEYSLDDCAKREFDYAMVPITQLIGKGANQISFSMTEVTEACRYAAEDAYVTWCLYPRYIKRLKAENLYELFSTVEIPLLFVLSKMEETGVHVDVNYLKELSIRYRQRANEISRQIYELVGSTFNINSTQQLSKVLFEDMHIKPIKKTKTGFSTDMEALEILAEEHIIAKLLIEYRQLIKLLTTYIDTLPEMINAQTDRIHSSFNQTVTSTGRLSCSNPNLQNIPIRSESGREIRYAFSASRPNTVIISADYSQIELRLMALYARDPNMLQAFRNGEDIHRQTASIMLGKPLAEITSDDRRKAKVINFGIIYGMGAQSLAKSLSISHKEAKEFIDSYFEKFPGVRDYMQQQKKYARENGYVMTLFNRKLWLPNINSTNQRIMADTERIAINMPIQGTAADLIKMAMIDLSREISNHPGIQLMIQVHDELVLEVEKQYEEEAVQKIKRSMELALPEPYRSQIPIIAEIGIGPNWAEAH